MNELIDLLPFLLCSGLILLLLFLRLFHLVSRDLSRHREQHERMERAWSELSSLTGLSFNRSDSTFSNKNSQLTGTFRGRSISLIKVTGDRSGSLEFSVGFVGYHRDIHDVFTEIKISVNNTGSSSLSVKEAGSLARSLRKKIIVSGDNAFDVLFNVIGSPDLFVRRALALIVSQKSLFLKRPPGTILLTDHHIISETPWTRPSIELNGSVLVCRQHGILTDNQKQIAFLNLLCDLAELAEQSSLVPSSYRLVAR